MNFKVFFRCFSDCTSLKVYAFIQSSKRISNIRSLLIPLNKLLLQVLSNSSEASYIPMQRENLIFILNQSVSMSRNLNFPFLRWVVRVFESVRCDFIESFVMFLCLEILLYLVNISIVMSTQIHTVHRYYYRFLVVGPLSLHLVNDRIRH